MRRFVGALGLSIAIHSTALLAASTIGRGERRPPSTPSSPLLVFLGTFTPNGGGAPGIGAGEPPTALPTEALRTARLALGADSSSGAAAAAAVAMPRVASTVRKPSARAASPASGHAPANGVANRAAGSSAAIGAPASGATSSGASGGGGSGGAGRASIAYEQALAAWLNTHKYYPTSLRRRGIEGEGKLRIRISRSGEVLGVDVAAAFPHPSLEAISQDWVKRAQPFPPVPEAIPGDDYVFVVPVGFRLQ